MTLCPFAKWEPVGPHSSNSIVGNSIGLVLHVNQGDMDPWVVFEQGDANSHWQVMKDGTLIQYIDADLDSWAQIAGNESYHSVETEGFTTEVLTPQQLATLAKLYAWGHKQYGWPLTIADAPGQPGFGWHGMGGNAWGHPLCPGDIRKSERPGILATASAALFPVVQPTPIVKPAPKPAPIVPTTLAEGDVMFVAFQKDQKDTPHYLCFPNKTKVFIPSVLDSQSLQSQFGKAIELTAAMFAVWVVVPAAV